MVYKPTYIWGAPLQISHISVQVGAPNRGIPRSVGEHVGTISRLG